MKVDGSVSSVLQGVSQQPRRSRLPGQCTTQVNMVSDPVQSLSRRPPLEWVDTLFSVQDNVQWFQYNRFGEIFLIAVWNGNLKIYDLTGVEYPVRYDNDSDDYLVGGSMSFTSIEDTLFVLNTNKTALMLSTTLTYTKNSAIVYILGGNYGKSFTVNVTVTTALGVATTNSVTFTTPNGSVATHIADIATTKIATELYDDLILTALFTGGRITVARKDDHIYIHATGATETLSVQVSDDANGSLMKVTGSTAKDANSLPRYAVNGHIVEIIGTDSSLADNWYLQFKTVDTTVANGSGFGMDGYWVECVAPNVTFQFDKTTMPHVLRYDFDEDEFFLDIGEWQNRSAGNNESNPLPSFVSNTINDLSVLHGRLVLISGVNMATSATNRPFALFKSSANVTVPSDPIDISSTATDLASFDKIVAHNRDLFIFADGGQFLVPGRSPISPDNAVVVKTTGFNANLAARPVSSGQSLFFALNYGQYTGIREFYTVSSGELDDSRPITEHVLRYMPGRIKHLACSSNFDILLASTTVDDNTVYIYEYVWNGDEKVQSSWSQWITRYPIEFFMFVEGTIYFVLNMDGQYVLHKVDLDLPDDGDSGYSVRLDSKITVVGDSSNKITIPDELPLEDLIFVETIGGNNPGMSLSVDSIDEDLREVTFQDSIDGVTLCYGYPFMSEYSPTIPYIPDEDGSKISTGILQIRNFILQLARSGPFYSKITSKYADDIITYHTPIFINDVDTLCGEPALSNATTRVPFMNNADHAEITFYTDKITPFTILDIEWLGDYRKRGQRIARGVQ